MQKLIAVISVLSSFAIPASAAVGKTWPKRNRTLKGRLPLTSQKRERQPKCEGMIPIGILATTFPITVKIVAAIKHSLRLRTRKRGAGALRL